jgi:hypothetical protein
MPSSPGQARDCLPDLGTVEVMVLGRVAKSLGRLIPWMS